MNQGKIIEYIDQGKFVCTLCLQDKGARLHLVTPLNREVNLSPKRAILISDMTIDTQKSREQLIEYLSQADAAREALKRKIDVKELWELIRDEQESFDHKYLAQLSFGEAATDDHLSALVRALFEDRLYFKLKDGHFFPNSEETVEQVLRQREEEAHREAVLSQGSSWLKSLLHGKATKDPDCKETVIRLLKDMALYGKDAPDIKYGKELLLKADIPDIRQSRNLLIKLGVWDEDENLDLHRLGIEADFDENLLLEASALAGQDIDGRGREDLRHLSVVTIDGPLTLDFDDAISLDIEGEILQLGVHIADASATILPNTRLDKEAADRASSLYLPRHHIPMLPKELSQEALSLKHGCDRQAISLLARLDKAGSVIDYRFVPSTVRVEQNLIYELVNERLHSDPLIREMYQLSLRLQERRVERGALNLSVPELNITFNSDFEILLELDPQDTPSRTIIAEFMILYNWLAAAFCRDNGIPTLYRTQAEPSERLQLNEDGYLYYVFQQRRKLNPLQIDTSPKPHSGLGLDIYTHSTSPLRRYLDLVAQRQISAFLMGKKPVYDEKGLDEIRVSVEPALRERMKVKRNRIRYWVLKFLRRHRDKTYPAIVLYEMKSRYRILLTDFLMVADIKRELNSNLSPAERIMVGVKKADPWEDILELTHAGGL